MQYLKDNWRTVAAAVALLIILVMLVCWKLWAPSPLPPETYKPAVRQVDASLVLERKPDATAKPAQTLPAGAQLLRKVSVTVQPKVQPQAKGGNVTAQCKLQDRPAEATLTPETQQAELQFPEEVTSSGECAPVTIDMSLIREADGGQRVIASSPDGVVLGGVDIPVENAAVPPAPKLWAVGIVGDPLRRAGGVFADRDIAFARVGVQVNQRESGGWPDQVWVKVGIRF